MRAAAILSGAVGVVVLVGVAIAVRRTSPETPIQPVVATAAAELGPGFLYGRVTAVDGATYEGRLRFGGDQEAFWNDAFNGARKENPWAALVPPERLPKERYPIEIFGIKIVERERTIDLSRPFMVPFGELARVDATASEVRATLKGGTVVVLDRFGAGDFDDGLRVWDERRGVVDLDSLRIRSIEFLPTPALRGAPSRLHGRVRTAEGAFAGYLLWNRKDCVGSDELRGRTADGAARLRFDEIRSIARRSGDTALVTLRDGREVVVSESAFGGEGYRDVEVDDPRYGGVLVSWGAFERVDFDSGDSGPAYGEFAPARPLRGTVTTRAGDRVSGRLVYDLDESATIETLDARRKGVNYSIPFGRIASIEIPHGSDHAGVTLRDGEELRLEKSGDLGDGNGGVLVFVDGRDRPEYVTWAEVGRIDFQDASTGSMLGRPHDGGSQGGRP